MNRLPAVPGQRGFSLVEVLISLVLGLMLIGVVFQVYLGSRQSQRLMLAVSSVQESLRYGTMSLGRDVQTAGWRGCNSQSANYYDTLRPTGNYLYQFQTPVQGAEATATGWTPALDPGLGTVLPGSDVLTVRYAAETNIYVRELMPSTSAVIKVNADADLSAINNGVNAVVVLSNCRASTVFQVTDWSAASASLVHNTGTDPPVGNATKDLGEAYTVGARVMTMRTVSYFLRESPHGTGPSLFRKVNDDPAAELVKGITDFQVRYGEDSDGDNLPDNYRTADAVTNWRDVISVRVALLAASLDGKVSEPDPRSFDLLGRVIGPFGDRRLRRAQTVTFAVRNATL